MKRDWSKYEPKFGAWAPYIKPFWESGGMDEIVDKIQERVVTGHSVIPDSSIVYRAFIETPPDKVKVFIFGLCPYHTAVKIDEKMVTVADGLAMSCSRTEILQPSLEHFYNGLEEEFNEGLCLKCYRNPDLKYLAEQGVFLGNIALTTEYLKVMRHGDIWKPFTEYFMDKVVGAQFTNIPVIFLGREAEYYYGYLAPFQWYFCISHPASAAYDGTMWSSEGTFTKVNKILEDQKKGGIQWLQEI